MTRCPPDVDVIHPRTYAVAGYPHAGWARLRREAPLARVEQQGFDPFWAVTRHADVKWFSKQPDRHPNPHLAFGIGEHFCLGANLARLELRVMFRQLAERVQALAPAGSPEWLASSFVGGIKHLPVRWRLRAAA